MAVDPNEWPSLVVLSEAESSVFLSVARGCQESGSGGSKNKTQRDIGLSLCCSVRELDTEFGSIDWTNRVPFPPEVEPSRDIIGYGS